MRKPTNKKEDNRFPALREFFS